MTTAQAIEELRQSPALVAIVRELQTDLETEAQRRARFLDEVSESEKAEFINGEVIVHSPVKWRHNDVAVRLLRIVAKINETLGGKIGFDKVMIATSRNNYEPDLVWYSAHRARLLGPDLMVSPPPDLVVEVLSPSTAPMDRGVKFVDYEAHGVGEYWIVDPERQTWDQYILRDGRYLTAPAGEMLTSPVLGDAAIARAAAFDDGALAAWLA